MLGRAPLPSQGYSPLVTHPFLANLLCHIDVVSSFASYLTSCDESGQGAAERALQGWTLLQKAL
eukprot:1159321-Pelagomonas_calceolata.AAC.10